MENVYVLYSNSSTFKFPAGEIGVNCFTDNVYERSIIQAHIQSSDDVMKVLMLNDALQRQGFTKIMLNMPYVPYARQDRVCNPGEALSIKVFADLINSCNFWVVSVWDVHSDVTLSLLNNVFHYEQSQVFSEVEEDWKNTIIIAPDAGAVKKAEKFAKDRDVKDLIVAIKKRDVKTGQLKSIFLTESVKGENVFVVDDLCDGGGTFIMLAEQLKDAKSKSLAVTHGIFSKGVEALTSVYDRVYTTNSYRPDLKSNDNLIVRLT